jgi:hypothetical protein
MAAAPPKPRLEFWEGWSRKEELEVEEEEEAPSHQAFSTGTELLDNLHA